MWMPQLYWNGVLVLCGVYVCVSVLCLCVCVVSCVCVSVCLGVSVCCIVCIMFVSVLMCICVCACACVRMHQCLKSYETHILRQGFWPNNNSEIFPPKTRSIPLSLVIIFHVKASGGDSGSYQIFSHLSGSGHAPPV